MTRTVDIFTLSERVNEQAERAGLSLTGLAAKSGLGKSTITSLLQTPDRNPRPSTLHKVAKALDVDPRYLIGETDDPSTWDEFSSIKSNGMSEGQADYESSITGDLVEYTLSPVQAGLGAEVAATALVDPKAPLESGTLYLADFKDGKRRIVYLAEPYLFWVTEEGEPSHAIRGKDVTILGKLLNKRGIGIK